MPAGRDLPGKHAVLDRLPGSSADLRNTPPAPPSDGSASCSACTPLRTGQAGTAFRGTSRRTRPFLESRRRPSRRASLHSLNAQQKQQHSSSSSSSSNSSSSSSNTLVQSSDEHRDHRRERLNTHCPKTARIAPHSLDRTHRQRQDSQRSTRSPRHSRLPVCLRGG